MPQTLRLICLSVCLLLATSVAQADEAWKIERFVLPPAEWPGLEALAFDETGTLWAFAQRHVYYLDGEQFVALDEPNLACGVNGTTVYEGASGGVYLTQPGADSHQRKLYRLRKNKGEFVTTIFYDDTPSSGIYVSKNGRIFHWGRDFLAVCADQPLAIVPEKAWKRIDAKFSIHAGKYPPTVCDLGDVTYFYSLQDNRIYCCDANNQWSVVDGLAAMTEFLPEEIRRADPALSYIAAAWCGDKVVVLKVDTGLIMAFDVRTGAPVELNLPKVAERKLSFQDVVSRDDGSVWLSLVDGQQASELTPFGRQFVKNWSKPKPIYELSPDGELRELPGTEGLGWTQKWRVDAKGSILEPSDGVFLSSRDGRSIYRDGGVTRLDWRNGLFAHWNKVKPGPDGALWTNDDDTGRSLVRITLGSGAPPMDESAEDWSFYRLAGENQFWRLSDNTFAMLEADHPDQLTRIAAGQTTYQKLPFPTSNIVRSIVDDRGDLLVELPSGRAFAIRNASVDEFANIEGALANSVANGAVRFQGSLDIANIFRSADQRLWYALRHERQVKMLEHGKWRTFSLDSPIDALQPFPLGGAFVVTNSSVPLRFQGEAFQRFPREVRYDHGVLYGPLGLPADAGDETTQYYPVRRESHGLHLFYDAADFDQAINAPKSEFTLQNSIQLPPYSLRRFDSPFGGQESPFGENPFGGQGSSSNQNPFGKQESPLDQKSRRPLERLAPPSQVFNIARSIREFQRTPLPENPNQVIAMANGDLWFYTVDSVRSPAANRNPHVYRFAQSKLSLKAGDIPAKCGRELTVAVAVEPYRSTTPVHLFSTIDGELQTTDGTRDGKITFRFPTSGEYRCVIFGDRFGGLLRDRIEFQVTAKVALPETNWYSLQTTVAVTDSAWRPPIRITPTDENQKPSLAWRIDGGKWIPFHQPFDPPGFVDLSAQKAGDYRIEFRASEEDFWHDPTPASVKIHFTPK